MNKRVKLGILILVLMIAIGFAAVTTNLIINGQTKIGMADFDVYFSEAESPTDDTVVLSGDKKSITFTSHELNVIGDEAVLRFVVYNNSRDYSANVSLDFDFSSTIDASELSNYIDMSLVTHDEDNDNYVSFGPNQSFILNAKNSKEFYLSFYLHSVPIEDFTITTNFTFAAVPISSEESNYDPIESLYDDLGYSRLSAGLYDSNLNMTKSWDDLIDEHIIYINDGVLSSNYNYDGTIEIPSVGIDESTAGEAVSSSQKIVSKLKDILGVVVGTTFYNPKEYNNFFIEHNTSCANLNGILVVDESVSRTVDYNFVCPGLKGVIFKKADYTTYDNNYLGFANIKLFNIPISYVHQSYNSSGQYYVTANKVIDGDFVYDNIEKTSIAAYIGNSKNIVIPEGVFNIGPAAFAYDEIDSITFPSSYKAIQRFDFANAIFDEIVIPSSIEELGDGAFNDVEFNNLSLSEGLKTIGDDIVDYPGLDSLTVPDSVESIGDYAFRDVTDVYINWSGEYPNYQWGASHINPFTRGDYLLGNVGDIVLYEYTGNDVSVVIPTDIKKIYIYAFGNRRDLVDISLPASLERIYYNAFYNCENLTNLIVPDTVTTIENNAFKNVPNVIYHGTLSTPSDYWGAKFFNKYIQNKIVFTDDTMKEVSSYVSSGDNVIIPEGVEKIKSYAFWKKNIKSVSLPNSLRYIEGCAFDDNDLTSITLPEGLLEISNHAFDDNKIAEFTIPNSVTSIGTSPFDTAKINTVFVHLPDNLPSDIDSGALYGTVFTYNGSNYISSFIYDAKAMNPYIEGDWVYSDSTKKTVASYLPNTSDYTDGITLTIPDGVTTISRGAFDSMANLKKVIMPDTVTYINEGAFRHSNSLEEVTLSNNLKYILDYAFGNHIMTEIHIPDSVIRIDSYAFSTSKSVKTKVYFPENSTWVYSKGTLGSEDYSIDSSVINDPDTAGNWLTYDYSRYVFIRRRS